MADNPLTYRRLPGRARKYFGLFQYGSARLWLGQDHVLLVQAEFFREQYKRFAFKDIQAIVVRGTSAGAILNAVLGVFLAASGLLALGVFLSGEIAGGVALFSIPLAVLIGLVVNVLFGPTCECHLRTAVQIEELTCLSRLNTARKTLAILRPIIEHAQGGLGEAETPVEGAELLPEAPPAQAFAAEQGPQTQRKELRPYDGRPHVFLFAVLLMDAVLTILHAVYYGKVTTTLNILWSVALIAALVTALVFQRDRHLSKEVRRLSWIALGFYCAFMALGQAYGVAVAFTSAFEFGAETIMDVDPSEHPFYLVSLFVYAAGAAVIGALGLRGVSRFRAQKAAAAATPGEPAAAEEPAAEEMVVEVETAASEPGTPNE